MGPRPTRSPLTHRCVFGVATVFATVLFIAGAGPHAQQDSVELFPNTAVYGRAAIEYQDDDLHVVAIYYYSQWNHDSKWIRIRCALSAERNIRIDREDIHLLTPGGGRVPLATQRAWSQDRGQIQMLIQQAQPLYHPILSYFNRQSGPSFNFFTSPGGTVSTDFIDANWSYRSSGDLYFASPAGAWEDGTYSLVFEVTEKGARAVLPIILE